MKKFLLFFLCFFYVSLLLAQNNGIEEIRKVIIERGEAKILIPKNSISDIQAIANIISLDYPQGDSWLGYVNKKQYESFLKLGIKHSIYIENGTKALTMASTMTQMSNWDRYPTYSVYDSMMRRFASTYPSLCKLDTIGFSVNNKLLLCLKISTNPSLDINKPKFLYTSTIHGDEITGVVLLLRLADWLLSNYGVNPRATNIINNTQVYINPIANPDGMYKPNNNSVSGATRYNSNYIDLNRNFPDPVLGAHPDGESYQRETSAFMAYANNNNFSISANLHGGAEVLNYPWDCYTSSSLSHPDNQWFESICTQFIDSIPSSAPSSLFKDVSSTGYTNGGDWYVVNGGRQDYQTYFKRGREITMEVSSVKSLSTTYLNDYWNYLGSGLITYIENCQNGIQGIVLDSATSQPLEAKIMINSHDDNSSFIYSNSNGYYYRPIVPSSYSITYSLDGYYSKTINATINSSSILTQDIHLVKNPNSLNRVNSNSNDIAIFPNPCNDIINIVNSDKQNHSLLYSVFNSQGHKVCSGNIIMGCNLVSIDCSRFYPGLYIINIGAKSFKFIKK